MIPDDPTEKQKAFDCKRKLAMDSFMEHMCILKALQVLNLEKCCRIEMLFHEIYSLCCLDSEMGNTAGREH